METAKALAAALPHAGPGCRIRCAQNKVGLAGASGMPKAVRSVEQTYAVARINEEVVAEKLKLGQYMMGQYPDTNTLS